MNFSDFFEALGVAAFGTKTGEPINCGAGLELEDSVSGGADDSYMSSAMSRRKCFAIFSHLWHQAAERRHSTAK